MELVDWIEDLIRDLDQHGDEWEELRLLALQRQLAGARAALVADQRAQAAASVVDTKARACAEVVRLDDWRGRVQSRA